MDYLNTLQAATYLTILSVFAVWFANSNVWKATYALTVIIGLFTVVIEPLAFIPLFTLGGALWITQNKEQYSAIAILVLVLLGALLSLHLVPGYNNHAFMEGIRLNESTAPFSIWYNYDKSMFGVLVFGVIFHKHVIRTMVELKDFFKKLMPIIVIGIPSILLIGVLIGYSKFDWSLTWIFLPWAIKNIFFTVLAEEMLFRGLIQRELLAHYSDKCSPYILIGLSGVIFGAAHFAGGIEYVFLSSVAGCVYGYAYYATRRIEAAILSHFSLNAIHFLFFSYPYLA